jgi:hypothetical protein
MFRTLNLEGSQLMSYVYFYHQVFETTTSKFLNKDSLNTFLDRAVFEPVTLEMDPALTRCAGTFLLDFFFCR